MTIMVGQSTTLTGAITVTGALTVQGSSISVGTLPATTGAVRLANAQYVYSNNAAQSGNILVIGVTGGNLVSIAGGNVTMDSANGNTVIAGSLTVQLGGATITGAVTVGAVTAISSTGIPQVPVIGPTFATADTTMTNANTFYTSVTLVSALAAGGTYLLTGNIVINDVSAGSSRFTIEIRDTTNNVTIVSIDSANTILNDVSSIAIPPIVYSGYAGTPTIVIRSESSGAADVVKAASAGTGATANKQTYLTAVRLA